VPAPTGGAAPGDCYRQIADCREQRLDRTSHVGDRQQAALLVAKESMARLGSAAATATATVTVREGGEKYNLLHE